MELDDEWRKSFELFLHFRTAKIQDLEGIENELIDNDTKRIWLTNTLPYQSDMDAAIRQAFPTENSSRTSQTKWNVKRRIRIDMNSN